MHEAQHKIIKNYEGFAFFFFFCNLMAKFLSLSSVDDCVAMIKGEDV